MEATKVTQVVHHPPPLAKETIELKNRSVPKIPETGRTGNISSIRGIERWPFEIKALPSIIRPIRM